MARTMKQKRTTAGPRKGCIVAKIERQELRAMKRAGWAL